VGTEKRQRQKQGTQSRLEAARAAEKQAARRARVIRLGLIGAATVLLVVATMWISGKSDKKAADKATDTTTTVADASTTTAEAGAVAPTCPPTDGSATQTRKFTGPFPDNCTDPSKTYLAKVDTTAGAFTIKLNPAEAPKTVNNFVSLARWKYYDGIVFHRIVNDFVIQAGDPTGTGNGGPGYSFADELPKDTTVYAKYAVAMANSGPNTNGSQFFVVTTDQGPSRFQAKYSAFGTVTEGQAVVDTLGKAKSGEPKINSVTITEG
jgi:cyclophilin family peptidyl-prolyl cis-trans isomerase